MSKPKFTPDPIHESASKEEVLEWARRQFERIEDWWPKDLSDRVEELENRNNGQTGTWPIVDYSSVLFEAEADKTELGCALAWWPIEPGYTFKKIEDIAANGLDLTLTNPAVITSENDYLSTDVRSGASSTRSFDGSYPTSSPAQGAFAYNASPDINALIENDCAIEFYIKRTTIDYSGNGEAIMNASFGQTDLAPPGWGGWEVRLNDLATIKGPAKIRFKVGLTAGRREYQTTVREVENLVWHKIRIEWTASTLSAVFKVDDSIVSSSTVLSSGSGTPQGRTLSNTSASADLGFSFNVINQNPPGQDQFNGYIDDVRLSTCIDV